MEEIKNTAATVPEGMEGNAEFPDTFSAQVIHKSNELISSKFKVSLQENRILAIATSRIQVNSVNGKETLEARLYPAELKSIFGKNSHIYRDLKKVSKTLGGHTMLIEDGPRNFHAFPIVTGADYVDGVFTVEFNERLKTFLLDWGSRSYTNLELGTLVGLNRNASFRLYELFKMEFSNKPKDVEPPVKVSYNVNEFKFLIGLANIEDQAVKNAMARMTVIDWDELYDVAQGEAKTYSNYTALRRRILEPAQEELRRKSNIRFEFEAVRSGSRVTQLSFSIYPNIPEMQDPALNEDAGFDMNTVAAAVPPAGREIVPVPVDPAPEEQSPEEEKQNGKIRRTVKRSKTETGGQAKHEAVPVESSEDKKETENQYISTWNQIRMQPRYVDFCSYIKQEEGVEMAAAETIFGVETLVQMYAEWRIAMRKKK